MFVSRNGKIIDEEMIKDLAELATLFANGRMPRGTYDEILNASRLIYGPKPDLDGGQTGQRPIAIACAF